MPPTDPILRLLLATVLGAAIGLEREYRQKPAGLRTNILIAVGSALFTLMSIQLAHSGGTPDRVAAQIVTGVGFLGGGAILRSRTSIHGMTTAIGMAAGAGQFLMASAATAITLAVLVVLPPIEEYFEKRASFPHRPSETKR